MPIVHEIEVVKAALGRCRSKVDSFHAHIYNRAVIAKNVDVQEVMPRLASRQQHRQNIQAQTCIDYYCLNLKIPLLDHLINEQNTQFDAKSTQNVVEFMHLIVNFIPILMCS